MRPQAKKATRNMIFCVCLALSILLNTACSGSASMTSQITKALALQQILVLPIVGAVDLSTFDPAMVSDTSSITATNLVFTGLVGLDNNLRVHPQLAESYFVAGDGVTWTFKLRPNLKFSDVTPLTSADVAYSIDRALSPSLKSPVSPLYLGLLSVAVPLTKNYQLKIKDEQNFRIGEE